MKRYMKNENTQSLFDNLNIRLKDINMERQKWGCGPLSLKAIIDVLTDDEKIYELGSRKFCGELGNTV